MLSSRAKKVIFLLLALAVIGLFIFLFFFFQKNISPIANGQNHTENGVSKDTIDPNSQIKSPASNTWHNSDFEVSVLDEDLESGIDIKSCQFKVLSYGSGGTVHSSGWLHRQCNFDGVITVGQSELCRNEGRQSCWIYITSQDKEGNSHTPSEEAKSIRSYNIDWTKPIVSKLFINENQNYPINIAQDTEYTIKVNVSDNFKITACNLYINNKDQGKMLPEAPGCSTECVFTKKFTPDNAGLYNIFAACEDAAHNVGQGDSVIAKTNIPPEISSCGVAPTSGDAQTNFQFSLQANDIDDDQLSVEWNFGDGKTSNESEPNHKYEAVGTFKPNVTVYDSAGAKGTCATAWVIVSQ